MTGQFTKALDRLAEAVQLEPRVVKWLKQGSALDPLRNLPVFQSLYAV